MPDRMKEVYYFFVAYYLTNKIPPAIRDVCGQLGHKSTSLIRRDLDALVGLGLLEKSGDDERRMARSYIPCGVRVEFGAPRREVLDSIWRKRNHVNADDLS